MKKNLIPFEKLSVSRLFFVNYHYSLHYSVIKNVYNWNSDFVCSLLESKTKNSEIKLLSEVNFRGSSLLNIARTLKENSNIDYSIRRMKHEYPNIPLDLCEAIIYWVKDLLPHISSSLSKMEISNIISKFSHKSKKRPLVRSFVDIEFKTSTCLVEQLSDCFIKLMHADDKQKIVIPFLSCGPGTGKSKTLQEIYPLTSVGKQFKDNSIEILISFEHDLRLQPEENSSNLALIGRILYSYLDVKDAYSTFYSSYIANIDPTISLDIVLDEIASHWRIQQNKEGEPTYFYLGIDECQELKEISENNVKTFLHGIVSKIKENILSSRSQQSNTYLFPFFAGLDYYSLKHVFSHFKFRSKYLVPHFFTAEDISNIVAQNIPQLIENTYLWKSIRLLGQNPRLLEFFLYTLKTKKSDNIENTKLIKQSLKIAFDFFNDTFVSDTITYGLACAIIAYSITEKKIMDFNQQIFSNGPTFKELEDKGYIRLIKVGDYFKCTSSLAILKKCYGAIERNETTESKEQSFKHFFEYLIEFTFTSAKDSPEFERFNSLYDIVLNKCLIYLSNLEMTISERYKGVVIPKNSEDLILNLKSFPTKQVINYGETINNQAKYTSFFDRHLIIKLNNQEHYTLLFFLHKTKSAYRYFSNNEFKTILDKHFTETNLSRIGATNNNSKAIILTSRPISSNISTNLNEEQKEKAKQFAFICRQGLEQYYGSFIFSLYLSSGMIIPFPINQTKLYSDNQLAFLLGIDYRKAKTLRQEIAYGKFIADMEDLKTRIPRVVNLSKELINFGNQLRIQHKDIPTTERKKTSRRKKKTDIIFEIP